MPEYEEAWELYSRYLNTQFVVDFHAFDFVFDTLAQTIIRAKTPAQALFLLEALIAMHEETSRIHREEREAELKSKQKDGKKPYGRRR